MSNINEKDYQAFRVTSTTRDGNEIEVFVLPPALHGTRRTFLEEYGNAEVEGITLAELEEATGIDATFAGDDADTEDAQ